MPYKYHFKKSGIKTENGTGYILEIPQQVKVQKGSS